MNTSAVDADAYPVWLPMAQMEAFRQDPFTVVAASGTHVWDDAGKEYIDFTSGLWNVNCGYSQPSINAAVDAQLQRLPYATLFNRSHPTAIELAEELLDLVPGDFHRVFYSGGGGAAVEATMKIARRWQRLQGRTDKSLIVGLTDSYHGTMYGAMTVTGQAIDQAEYVADDRNVRHLVVNDVAAVHRLFQAEGERIAAIFLEPVLGNGCVELMPEFCDAVFDCAREHSALVVADEVATGFGRTGSLFATERWTSPPDMIIFSKAINNGYLPLAVTLASVDVTEVFDNAGVPLLHGETQAGNPAACAAALATIKLFEDQDILEGAHKLGEHLDRALESLTAHPLVQSHQGAGMMRSIRFITREGSAFKPQQAHAVRRRLRDHGVISYGSPSGLMLMPPLVTTVEEIDDVLTQVQAVLDNTWF